MTPGSVPSFASALSPTYRPSRTAMKYASGNAAGERRVSSSNRSYMPGVLGSGPGTSSRAASCSSCAFGSASGSHDISAARVVISTPAASTRGDAPAKKSLRFQWKAGGTLRSW